MTSFVQQVEGPQAASIGNQQIVQKDSSHINTLARGINSGIQAIDTIAGAVGEVKARDLVSKAQQQLDTEVNASDQAVRDAEIALNTLSDDAAADEIQRKTASYERAIAQGKITRENARLRVADLVTKGIEESPFIADKIRRSASRLLGFDPTAEATQQFFGGFQPKGSGQSRTSAFETKAQFLAANTNMNIQQAREKIAIDEELALRKSTAQSRVELGAIANDQFIAERDSIDQIEGVGSVLGGLLQLQREGQTIDSNAINQQILVQEQAYIAAVETEAREAGRPLTTDQLSKLRSTAADRYDALRGQLESFDTLVTDKKFLERVVTANKIFGTKAMPNFAFLVDFAGERTASSLIDLYANVAGNPERLRAVLDSNPAMRRFIPILEANPDEFSRMLNNTVTKLADPAAVMDEEDAALTDFFLGQVGNNLPPTEHETVVEMLASKGAGAKAISSISSRGRNIATPREVEYTKGEWELAQDILPDEIRAAIDAGNQAVARSNQGVSISVNEAGLLSLDKFKPDGSPDPQRFLHPAYNSVQKINQFLKMSDKGWGKDLGIKDKTAVANQIRRQIESPAITEDRMDELRQEAMRRLQEQGNDQLSGTP